MEIYSKPSIFYQHILDNKDKKYLKDGVMIQDVGLRELISRNSWEKRLLNRFIKYEIIDGYLDLNDHTFSYSQKISKKTRSEGVIALLAFDTSWYKKEIKNYKVNGEPVDLSLFISDTTKESGHTLILEIERILNRRAYNEIPVYNFSKLNSIYTPLVYHNFYYSFFKSEDDLFSFVMYYTYHLLYLRKYPEAKAFLIGKSLYGIIITEENIKYFLPQKIDYHHDPIKFLSLFRFVVKNFKKCKTDLIFNMANKKGYKSFTEIPIFTYWDSGFSNISWPLKNIVASQSKLNHDNFKVINLSHETIGQYIDIPQYIEKIRFTYPANYSDYIRLALLEKYGGVWLDASIYINKSDAISKIDITNDDYLYAYYFSGSYRNISNFFMYVKSPNNYIIGMMKSLFSEYYKSHDFPIDYFVFHKIFRYLTFLDKDFHDNWLASTQHLVGLEHGKESKILFKNVFDEFDEKIWNSIDMIKINRKDKRIKSKTYITGSYVDKILGDI